jgi:hypothetical protein
MRGCACGDGSRVESPRPASVVSRMQPSYVRLRARYDKVAWLARRGKARRGAAGPTAGQGRDFIAPAFLKLPIRPS